MHKRILLVLACSGFLAAGPALSGEAPAPKPGGATMLMSPVAIPVVVGGRLSNFIYITLRLNLRPGTDAEKLRAQEPFFRDALIRDAYRTPLQLAADPNQINEPALRAMVLTESARIAGRGVVTGVQLTRVQPQHFLPKPAPPKARPAEAPVV